MNIEKIRIKNFRSFKDEIIHFRNYNCFVGANGVGKSTILHALNVFFRNNVDSKTDVGKLHEEDFHHKNTKDPIEITVTFDNLNNDASKDLKDYVRQGKLVISAKAFFNEQTGVAEVRQYGNRLGINDFRKWFEAEKSGQKVSELKEIYDGLRKIHEGLPEVKQKAKMSEELNLYESKHFDKCKLIPSEDQFYGISKGVNKLAPYVQWVFVSASKDLTLEGEESKKSALGELLSRTVRTRVNFSDKVQSLRNKVQEEYQQIINSEQEVLEEISSTLEDKLKFWAHPKTSAKVLWKNDLEKGVKVEEPFAFVKLGERDFEGEVSRFGHGLQRSFMFCLLQELALTENSNNGPNLIMGIEEPELYQHPPQAKHLSEVLKELSEKKNQIILCTHSPAFVPGDDFESVTVIKEKSSPSHSYAMNATYQELSTHLDNAGDKPIKSEGMVAKLFSDLTPVINEIFFSKRLVLVEGIEDVACVTTYLSLTGKLNEFRRKGFHIVPVGGKSNLKKPLCIARILKIPVYVVCDADSDEGHPEKQKKHQKDNQVIQSLLEIQDNPWPKKHVKGVGLTMWKSNITMVVEEEIKNIIHYRDIASKEFGKAADLKKNPLAIAKTLELAWNKGFKSKSLIQLVFDILDEKNTFLLEDT